MSPIRVRKTPLLTLLLLVLARAAAAQAPPPAAERIENGGLGGTSWQLVGYRGGEGRRLTADERPNYTVAFDADGTVSVRFDCNTGRGAWKASGAKLELAGLRLTRAACPTGSLYDRLARDWSYIRTFARKEDHLFLALEGEKVVYEFEPTAAKPLPRESRVASVGPFTFQCQGASGASETVTATFYETQPGLLLFVRGGQTRPAFQIVAGSGTKYEGPELTFWEHQGEAVVDWSGSELRCKRRPTAPAGN
jgi:heat shock protein HslJ/membrane-bound inhibitor of C-type lysozyme